jgi:predicted GIY-YIG superfamily endonuclease
MPDVMSRTLAPRTGRTALYRHRDENGTLLYVGISLTLAHRLAAHANTSHWFRDVVRVDIEWFPTRDEALKAERHAIQCEHPRCNIAHAKIRPIRPGRTPRPTVPAEPAPRRSFLQPSSDYASETFGSAREARVFLYRTYSELMAREKPMRELYEEIMARQPKASEPINLGHRFWLRLTDREFEVATVCGMLDEAEFLLDHCEFMSDNEDWLMAADDLWSFFMQITLKWAPRRDELEFRWPGLAAA